MEGNTYRKEGLWGAPCGWGCTGGGSYWGVGLVPEERAERSGSYRTVGGPATRRPHSGQGVQESQDLGARAASAEHIKMGRTQEEPLRAEAEPSAPQELQS